METKHTSGKWYVSDIPQEDGRYIYTKENPFSAIARVYKGENPHSLNAQANAKLIASAPSLLDALQSALPYLHKETRIKAEEAIKKATE